MRCFSYLNNGKLFVGPHLLVCISMTCGLAMTASLSQLMRQSTVVTRKVQVMLNIGVFTLFFWKVLSGMGIMSKIVLV